MRKKPVGILKKDRIQQTPTRVSKKSLKTSSKSRSRSVAADSEGTKREGGSQQPVEHHSAGTASEAAVGGLLARRKDSNDTKESGAPVGTSADGNFQASKQHGKQWGCRSVVDKQAATAVRTLLAASERGRKGATIKGLTLAPHIQAKKATFKVTCETLRLLPQIKHALEETRLLQQHRRLPKEVAYVLCYEAVFGEGLKPHGPAERALLAAREQLHVAAHSHSQNARQSNELGPQLHPRSARVNSLKLSVAAALAHFQDASKPGWQAAFQDVEVDPLLPDVLIFPPGTDLHAHPLVESGALVLQSKASCMPAHALQPERDWLVLDACAAPGNKTTHLAALMGGGGRVIALDRDPKRLKRLQQNVRKCGASTVEARCSDFLATSRQDAELAGVQGILLDPSCSGSGTAASRMDHLLPKAPGARAAEQAGRVAALAAFQKQALEHALGFPGLQRLVYSTCSVHAEENEEVVKEVLAAAKQWGFELVDPFPAWSRRGLPLLEGADKLIRTDPGEDGTDGFFLAVFQRA